MMLIVCAVLAAAAAVLPARSVLAQCPAGAEVVLQGGVPDAFALPTEPATPDSALAAFISGVLLNPVRAFDESGLDKTLGHTFTGTPLNVCSAVLTIRVRALGPLSENDTISLEYVEDYIPGQTSAFAWGLSIASMTGTGWSTGEVATLVLDLRALPPDPHGRTSVIAEFADGDFDVVVDDDTQVDYVSIALCTDCSTPTETTSWGQVKSRFLTE